MSRRPRRSILLACAGIFGASATLVMACASSDDPAAPAADAGDAATLDASDPGDGDVSPRSDAAESLVDASLPAVTCAVTPCAVEIAAGFDSVCVRLSDGTVRCWGSNGAGELGRGPDTGSSANTPAPVLGLNDAVQISGSTSPPGDAYCALRANGSVVCWGANENGVLGRVSEGDVVDTESSPTPAPVAGLGAATGVFAGHFVSCATLVGGDIACWGSNAAAQIPAQPSEGGERFRTTPFSIGAKGKLLGVADRGTVALTETGLVSWGLSGDPLGPRTGVLGREVSTGVSLPAGIALTHVSVVVANTGRACAIANGQVFCWGAGPIAGSDSVYPTYAGVGSTSLYAQTIALGPRSACVTLSNGTATCWGDNTRGQLGAGNFDHQPTPVRVEKLGGIPVRMAVMESTACAILATGAVQCWGQNDKGQLGTGTADALPHLEPQNVVLTP